MQGEMRNIMVEYKQITLAKQVDNSAFINDYFTYRVHQDFNPLFEKYCKQHNIQPVTQLPKQDYDVRLNTLQPYGSVLKNRNETDARFKYYTPTKDLVFHIVKDDRPESSNQQNNIEFTLLRGQTNIRSYACDVRGKSLRDIEEELKRMWGLNQDEKLRFQDPQRNINLNLVESEEPARVFQRKGIKQVSVVCEQTAG